ncbi:MAG TPA: flagellar protein FlaG [Burkholderiaceae bacterium]|nr:flagellar protein FlaG [Burkholderiaceae bacterium]
MQSISSVGPASAAGVSNPQDPRHAASPGAAAAPAQGEAPTAVTPAQLKAAVDAANQALDQSNREISFVFDDKLGRMLVKIIDKRTNTVVRQVPSEEMLAAARALSDSGTRGALLKSKA